MNEDVSHGEAEAGEPWPQASCLVKQTNKTRQMDRWTMVTRSPRTEPQGRKYNQPATSDNSSMPGDRQTRLCTPTRHVCALRRPPGPRWNSVYSKQPLCPEERSPGQGTELRMLPAANHKPHQACNLVNQQPQGSSEGTPRPRIET